MPKHLVIYANALSVGAMCLLVLSQNGFDEDSVRLAIRLTAATSFALLLCTFVARPLFQLTGHPLARTLLRNRRQLGISMAISHSFHLAMIFLLVPIAFDNDMSQLGSLSDNLGGIALYVLLYVMTLTSNNASQRLLGKGWLWLHKLGSYTLMLVFTSLYLGNSLAMGGHYWLLATLGGLAFILRFLNWRRSKLANQASSQVPATN